MSPTSCSRPDLSTLATLVSGLLAVNAPSVVMTKNMRLIIAELLFLGNRGSSRRLRLRARRALRARSRKRQSLHTYRFRLRIHFHLLAHQGAVDHMQKRQGAGFNDIGADGPAAD